MALESIMKYFVYEVEMNFCNLERPIMNVEKTSMKRKQGEMLATENIEESWTMVTVYLQGKITYLKITLPKRTVSKVN